MGEGCYDTTEYDAYNDDLLLIRFLLSEVKIEHKKEE
jgi:hypothetical protein